MNSKKLPLILATFAILAGTWPAERVVAQTNSDQPAAAANDDSDNSQDTNVTKALEKQFADNTNSSVEAWPKHPKLPDAKTFRKGGAKIGSVNISQGTNGNQTTINASNVTIFNGSVGTKRSFIGRGMPSRGRFEESFKHCDRFIRRFNDGIDKAYEKASDTGKLLAAAKDFQALYNELNDAMSGEGDYDVEPMPHFAEAVRVGSFIANTLMSSAEDNLSGYAKIAVSYGVMDEIAQTISKSITGTQPYYLTLLDKGFEYGDQLYERRGELPDDYYYDFRDIAKSYLQMVKKIRGKLASDRVELELTGAVVYSTAEILDESVWSRDYWREIVSLASLNDRIQDVLASDSEISPLFVKRVRRKTDFIIELISTRVCELKKERRESRSDDEDEYGSDDRDDSGYSAQDIADAVTAALEKNKSERAEKGEKRERTKKHEHEEDNQ